MSCGKKWLCVCFGPPLQLTILVYLLLLLQHSQFWSREYQPKIQLSSFSRQTDRVHLYHPRLWGGLRPLRGQIFSLKLGDSVYKGEYGPGWQCQGLCVSAEVSKRARVWTSGTLTWNCLFSCLCFSEVCGFFFNRNRFERGTLNILTPNSIKGSVHEYSSLQLCKGSIFILYQIWQE